MELLSYELQFSFAGGRLWVKDDATGGGDLIGCIEATPMGVWRFLKFTTSRWLTVGHASRVLTAALLTGLSDLVKFIITESGEQPKYIRGVKRLKDRGKRFAVQATLGSRVADAFQLNLMRDSRIALTYPDLWMTLSEEMKWLIDLDDGAWDVLASMCDMEGEEVGERVHRGGPRELPLHLAASVGSCGISALADVSW